MKLGLIYFRSLLTQMEKQSRSLIEIPFVVVKVHGFADSPVSWYNNQHQYHSSGENDFTIVLLPGDSYWQYVSLDCDQFT